MKSRLFYPLSFFLILIVGTAFSTAELQPAAQAKKKICPVAISIQNQGSSTSTFIADAEVYTNTGYYHYTNALYSGDSENDTYYDISTLNICISMRAIPRTGSVKLYQNSTLVYCVNLSSVAPGNPICFFVDTIQCDDGFTVVYEDATC